MLTTSLTIAPAEGTWVIRAGGAVIGETSHALELHEDGHHPVIYFPRNDLGMAFLETSATRSLCPMKGEARYFGIVTRHGLIADAGWSYETPVEEAGRIAGYIAFYPRKVTIERV